MSMHRPYWERSLRHAGLAALGAALVLAASAFRCPGPDPHEAPAGGGNGGQGGQPGQTTASESSVSATSSEASTTVSTSVASTTVATTSASVSSSSVSSSSMSASASSSSGGCMANLLIDPQNCGECNRVCDPTNTVNVSCDLGVCTSTCLSGFVNILRPQAPAGDDGCEAPGRRAFVTSFPEGANFNTSAGADMLCQGFADAEQLGGTWLSWTSDFQSSPSTRFNQSAVPYMLVDGTIIANDWADLTDGSLANPIDVDETGVNVGVSEVWTGTLPDGTKPGSEFCANWNSNNIMDVVQVGRADMAGPEWSNIFNQTCDRNNVRLYCFEQ
jgi:hypothetical protein